jgi:hypothetical protein
LEQRQAIYAVYYINSGYLSTLDEQKTRSKKDGSSTDTEKNQQDDNYVKVVSGTTWNPAMSDLDWKHATFANSELY